MLTLDQILNQPETLPFEEVQVPEWGGSVFLGRLTGAQWELYLDRAYKERKDGSITYRKAMLVCMCLRDSKGNPIGDISHAAAMARNKSGIVIHRLFQECERLNPFSTNEVIENAKKNCNETAGGEPSGEPQPAGG